MIRAIAGLTLALTVVPAPLAAEDLQFFSVGTGELDGGYFRVAQAICAAVNDAHGGTLRCSPETTPGSIYNLEALATEQLDLALVQSDWQAHAWDGTSVFAARGPFEALRSLVALHSEPVVLVVRADAGIEGFGDLAGRRVDIGHPSSGRRATMMALLAAHGLSSADFLSVSELQTAAAYAELCTGRIDATLVITGHPSNALGRTMADCEIALVGLTGPAVDGLVEGQPGFVPGRIAPAAYPGLLPGAVDTFAVRATLVARHDTPDAIVTAVVEAALDFAEGQATNRAREPLLRGLAVGAMRASGLTAPLHPAAEAAFDAP